MTTGPTAVVAAREGGRQGGSGSESDSSELMAPLEDMGTPRMERLEGGAADAPTTPASQQPGAAQHRVETLAWRNLSYFYKIKGGKAGGRDGAKEGERAAVKRCTGVVKRGDMVAVMGPSGAGKSSLFDVLARRIGTSGRLEGEMFVNGAPLDDKRFLRISEYVQHEDVFVPTQTLLQALEYHANLRLGPTVSYAEKRKRIDTLLFEAGLQDKLTTRIGGILAGGITIKGLSNGEKRRLSVVCAAIANPAILFLDEPTSGLDSFAALKVMEMMAKYAMGGRLIVCTIHQPRSQVYELFNKVLILSQGETVYFGGTKQTLHWFETALQRVLPLGTSIPDFVLDLVNVSFEEDPSLIKSPSTATASTTASAGGAGKGPSTQAVGAVVMGPVDVSHAAELFRKSQEFQTVSAEIDAIVAAGARDAGKQLALGSRADSTSISWWYRFSVVLGRNMRFYVANPGNVLVRLLISLTVGVFQGVVFYKTPAKQPLMVQSISLLICLFVTQLQALLVPFVSMTLFIEDRKFFVRESASRLYSTSNYFLANALLELMLTTTGAIIYGVLTYMLCFYASTGDFAFDPAKFLVYVLFVVVGAHTGSMQAIMCSILSPSLEIACALNVGITCVFCFGGIPPRLLFDSAKIIQWVSPLKYSYTAMVESYFRNTAGRMYVDMLDVTEPKSVGVNLGCMLFFFVFYNVVSFWALDKLYRNKH